MGTPHSGGQSFQLSLFCTFGYGTHELKSDSIALKNISNENVVNASSKHMGDMSEKEKESEKI